MSSLYALSHMVQGHGGSKGFVPLDGRKNN